MRSVDMEYGLASRRDAQNLFIRGGRVQCRERGDIGVETCLGCRHLRGFAGGEEGVVICDHDPDLMTSFVPGMPREWERRSRR